MTVPNVHGGDQGIVVREKDNMGIYVGEGDWPIRGRGWARQDHSTGHFDVDGPLLRGGTLFLEGTKEGVYLQIVDEGLCCLILRS